MFSKVNIEVGEKGYVPVGAGEGSCGKASIPTRLYCTLDQNHDGLHVAHGQHDRMIAIFDHNSAEDIIQK